MITSSSPTRVELTIRRPTGETETVVWPHHVRLTDAMFRQIQDATRAAGKGEVVSYQNVAPVYQMTEADKHEQAMDQMMCKSYTRI